MSMLAYLKKIPNETAQQIESNPEVIDDLIPYGKLDEEAIEEFESDALEIGKYWDILEVWLSDEPTYTVQAVLGGGKIGPDLGYGPVRYLSPNAVRETYQSLSTISDESLDAWFDVEELNDDSSIYPGYWVDNDLVLMKKMFSSLVNFYRDASETESGMLLYLI